MSLNPLVLKACTNCRTREYTKPALRRYISQSPNFALRATRTPVRIRSAGPIIASITQTQRTLDASLISVTINIKAKSAPTTTINQPRSFPHRYPRGSVGDNELDSATYTVTSPQLHQTIYPATEFLHPHPPSKYSSAEPCESRSHTSRPCPPAIHSRACAPAPDWSPAAQAPSS